MTASSSSCGNVQSRRIASIGLVSSRRGLRSARSGSPPAPMSTQLDGKPTSSVDANANRASSRLRRLWRCVVPVRGCPNMINGLDGTRILAISLPNTIRSTTAAPEFITLITDKNTSRCAYPSHAISLAYVHIKHIHCCIVIPLNKWFRIDHRTPRGVTNSKHDFSLLPPPSPCALFHAAISCAPETRASTTKCIAGF